MARKHYRVRYRLDGVDRYLIWFSNDSDGVVVEADRSVASFRTRCDLDSYADCRGLAFEPEETAEFDFDSIEAWLRKPDGSSVECEVFLNAWNLFDDIASSRRYAAFQRSSRSAGLVYDKLFWGSNVPAVTPLGERYVPSWSDREVAELRRVLSEGMRLMRDAISGAP
jgi:hypothetical protein